MSLGASVFGGPSSSSRASSSQTARQANSSTTTPGMETGMTYDDEDGVGTSYLQPPAYTRGEKQKWSESGRTFNIAVSPAGGQAAAWVAKRPGKDANKPVSGATTSGSISLSDKTIYIANQHVLSEPLTRFYIDTYEIFISLQAIVAMSFKLPSSVSDPKAILHMEGLHGPPGAETVGHMSRLVTLYLTAINTLREGPNLEPVQSAQYDAIYHVFQLAEILFLPQDGRGEGLLGEELLDWVNDVDPAPDNTQGNEIMQSNPPWDHPSFWPYLSRCLLRGFHLPAATFLRSLSNHPHAPISKLASLLASHLSQLPRSTNTAAYALDHQFITAHKQWLDRFQAELTASTNGEKRGKWFDEGRNGKYAAIEKDFIAVVELMEGKPERVLEESSDWREALGAWGVLVDLTLRRDDLPSVTARVCKQIPVDSEMVDDVIQSSLCAGEIVKALTCCHDLDIWLAAHLADVFDKLAMVQDEDRFDMSLRDYFLLEHTDVLSGNDKHNHLWKVIADYLNAAGDEGRRRLKELILHVSLDSANDLSTPPVNPPRNTDQDDDMEMAEPAVPSAYERFYAIREACQTLNLHDEYATISRIMGNDLLRKGDFGIAAVMFAEAQDALALSHLADRVFDEFVNQGEEAFLAVVSQLPPILLDEGPTGIDEIDNMDQFGPKATVSAYSARLAHLAVFRDYLLYKQQGDREMSADRLVSLLVSSVAPVKDKSVLLAESIGLLEDPELLIKEQETFELMRVLEEVMGNATFAPNDYLGQLAVYLDSRNKSKKTQGDKTSGGRDWTSAREKMEEVRLALARNLARALVQD